MVVLLTRFVSNTDFNQMKVVCFSQGTVTTFDVTFLLDSMYQKLLKSVNF